MQAILQVNSFNTTHHKPWLGNHSPGRVPQEMFSEIKFAFPPAFHSRQESHVAEGQETKGRTLVTWIVTVMLQATQHTAGLIQCKPIKSQMLHDSSFNMCSEISENCKKMICGQIVNGRIYSWMSCLKRSHWLQTQPTEQDSSRRAKHTRTSRQLSKRISVQSFDNATRVTT